MKPQDFYKAIVDSNVKQQGLTQAHEHAQQACVTRQALAYTNGNRKEGDAYFKEMMMQASKRNK